MAGRGLLFLLSFVWVVEWFDIPMLVCDAPAAPFHLARAALLTAGILGAAVIAIGHTYEQQRGLLRKLLETCVYCHRVKLPDGLWEHVDVHFIRHYPVGLQRGTCPDCEQMLNHVSALQNRGVPATVRPP